MSEIVTASNAEVRSGNLAARLGRGLGAFAYSSLRIRRAVVERQLSDSFPERDPQWVHDTAAACYRHFGRELVETVRMARASPDRLIRRIRNPEAYEPVLAGPCVLVSAHIGNWELAGSSVVAMGGELTAVARRQTAAVHRYITRVREDSGMEIVSEDVAPLRARRALANGRVVGLIADQHAGRQGAILPFLGRPASTTLGPARLALAARVPLIFGVALRDGEGYRAVCETIAMPERGEGDALELTRRWVARLEAEVRGNPEQYYWFHRRWKTRAGNESRGRAVGVSKSHGDTGT